MKNCLYLLIGILLISCVDDQIDQKKDDRAYQAEMKKRQFISDVATNTWKGSVIELIYISQHDTVISGSGVGEAIGGGAIGYVLLGPIGLLLGAAAGADGAKSESQEVREEMLLVTALNSTTLDTHYFEIVEAEETYQVRQSDKFRRSDPVSLRNLAGAITKPGTRFKIASSKPLSLMCEVSSDFVYLNKEEIQPR